jgi:hypothetical protein
MPALLQHEARPPEAAGVVGFFVRVVGWIALTAWHATRITLLALLVAFEPLVRTVLSVAAMLLIAMALFLEYGYSPRLPGFEFVPMLLCGLGSAVTLLGYYALIRFLMRG